MDYPCAIFYTFLTIFAQNLAILTPKQEVPYFQEVYQTFTHFWNTIETNIVGYVMSSEFSEYRNHR